MGYYGNHISYFMLPEFQQWHEKKSQIDMSSYRTYFQERDIWWCSIGKNVGFEQNGKGKNFARPVIVLRKFSNEVFWGVPLTTKIKTGKYYVSIDLGDGITRTATLSQLRLIDGKRLYQKLGSIPQKLHQRLIQGVINLCRAV